VQARTGSSRFPQKILQPILGKPVLQLMMERVLVARQANDVIVATTCESNDDPIVQICQQIGIECFRGDTNDLLDRHYQAAKNHQQIPDAVVKIPSDCPLIDPRIIDKVIGEFRYTYGAYDYISNLHPQSYPDGNDVEVMTFDALERAWLYADKPHEREHTTPYIWDNPHLFRCGNVRMFGDVDYSLSHRWVLDYPEDFLFIKAVYSALYKRSPLFSCEEILQLVDSRQELTSVNAHYIGVNWYRHHLDELKTISANETKQL
jgi:spore coat polysaccharide biosynthesis protein SpsF